MTPAARPAQEETTVTRSSGSLIAERVTHESRPWTPTIQRERVTPADSEVLPRQAMAMMTPVPPRETGARASGGASAGSTTSMGLGEEHDGIYPTRKMIERFCDRFARVMAEQLDFDDEQRVYFQEVLRDRVPAWFANNRSTLKPLINEYIETLLSDTPPAPREVAAWAAKALPMVDQVNGLAEACVADLRPALSEDQVLELEGDLAALRTGVSFLRSKLELWEAGGYDPAFDWPTGAHYANLSAAEAIALRNAQEQARAEVTGSPVPMRLAGAVEQAPPDEEGGVGALLLHEILNVPRNRPVPAQPNGYVDPWDRYAADFIERYQLTASQADTAYRYAREAKQLRDRYLEKNLNEYRRLDAALQSPGPKDLAALRAAYEKLQAPVDRFYMQMQERLEKLPTRAQRRAAVQRGASVQARG
jgi:hypothetical protein